MISRYKSPVEEFDLGTLSFPYGDSYPTFSPRVNDGKEYRNKNFLESLIETHECILVELDLQKQLNVFMEI